jgi:hypothetical protein
VHRNHTEQNTKYQFTQTLFYSKMDHRLYRSSNRGEPSSNEYGRKTELRRDHSERLNQSQHSQDAIHTPSILRTEHDVTMASRQTRINSLPPAERQEQEQWAQKQIHLTGACIGGWWWTRVQGGYRCGSGNCKVTDELLAAGNGGFLSAHPQQNLFNRNPNLQDQRGITWVGPFYKNAGISGFQPPRQVLRR